MQNIRANKKGGLKEGEEDPNGTTYHQGMSYVPEAIGSVLIRGHHNDQLARDSRIEKSRELIARRHQAKPLQRFPSFDRWS